ncbi:TlpA family protein disulfide reductase [Chloroflexota bacterium]
MNKMLKIVVPIVLGSALLLIGCQYGGETPEGPVEGTQIGNLAPNFQLQDLDKQTLSLRNLRGKPVLINFWTSWCSFCREEMAYLQQIHEEWSGKGLVLLTINISESPLAVKEFSGTYNLSMTMLLDTAGDVADKYNIPGIPTTFFIDKNGIIRGKVIGPFPGKAAIEDYLSRIIP